MKSLRTLVAKLGYEITSRKKSHLTLSDHLTKVLATHKIDNVIDVGANEGQFAKQLRAGGYEGRIVSFEPIPHHAQKVAAYFSRDQNYSIHNCALGEAPGTLELNIYNDSVFSSFLQPSDRSHKYFGADVDLARKVQVPVQRLDQVGGIVRPGEKVLLKMDTQGYDLRVFAGATSIIPSVQAILVECSVIPLYEGAPNYIDTLSVFFGQSFVPSGFFPISRDEGSLALIEFDCLMIRRQAADPEHMKPLKG